MTSTSSGRNRFPDDDPFAPWNEVPPLEGPWDDPAVRHDPLAPWNDSFPGRLVKKILDWNARHWWAEISLTDHLEREEAVRFPTVAVPVPIAALPGDGDYPRARTRYPWPCQSCGCVVVDFVCVECGETVCPLCQPVPEGDEVCVHRVLEAWRDDTDGWTSDERGFDTESPLEALAELRRRAAAAARAGGWVIGREIDTGGMGGGVYASAVIYVPDPDAYRREVTLESQEGGS